jgi:glyoxylase I family protein
MIPLVSPELDPPRLRGVHHLGLSVRDLDRSIAFYCDVLGAVLARPPYEGESPAFSGRMAIVALGATGLDLFEHAGNEQEPFNPVRTGLDHLGFAAESAEELQSWADWLESCNIPHSGVRDIVVGGTEPIGAMLDFRDPDGIQVEFLFRDTAKIQRLGTFTPD